MYLYIYVYIRDERRREEKRAKKNITIFFFHPPVSNCFQYDRLTMIITCSTPFLRASSPILSQYLAELLSSPSIIVEPWEKKWTGDNFPS